MSDKPTSEDVYSALNKLLEDSRTDINRISEAIEELGTDQSQRNVTKQVSVLAEKVSALDERLVQTFDLTAALYSHATTDGLTGFKTKAYFDTVVKPRLSQYPDIAYLMVDIDHFKRYNDSYGHPQGDEAIRSVTGVIQRVAPTDLLFRFGGEEFSVIAVGYDVDKRAAREIAEAIRQGVESNVIQIMAARSVADDVAARVSEAHDWNIGENDLMLVERFCSYYTGSHIEQEKNLTDLLNSLSASIGGSGVEENKTKNMIDFVRSYLFSIQRATVSIGGSVREVSETIDNLIKRADDALYVAKKTRNSVFIAD